MKQCVKCGQNKPLEMFPSHVKKKNGVRYFRSECKSCVNIRAKLNYQKDLAKSREYGRNRYHKNIEWSRKNYAKNREDILQKHKEYRKTMVGRVNGIYNSAKARAKNQNAEFTITKDFILEALIYGVCQRTGIAFSFEPCEDGSTRHKFSPSIDKKDRKKGYTLENSQIVVWCYNTGKGEMSDKEFIEFCKRVAEKNK